MIMSVIKECLINWKEKKFATMDIEYTGYVVQFYKGMKRIDGMKNGLTVVSVQCELEG